MKLKQTVTVLTAACFLLSFVFAPALEAAAEMRRDLRDFRQVLDDFVIPPAVGRISQGKYFGPGKVVVNIQDLHCNPEVQRNISRILSILDQKCELKNIYVEGAYGSVDTSWLCNIREKVLREKIIETMIDRGDLTGTEYYSVKAKKPGLLKGLEDRGLHTANIVRLGRIMEKKEYYEKKLAELDRELAFLEAKYYSVRNKRFNRAVAEYKRGGMDAERYYRLLVKYAVRINADPDRFNSVFTIRMANYGNITRYMELMDLGKRLKYRRIAYQLQEFVQVLKAKLPYNAYNYLLQKTGNFSDMDGLYVCLAKIAREYRLDLRQNYPDLQEFFAYAEKSREINPLALIREEKRLVEEIRVGLAQDTNELEISFLEDFAGYFRDYLLNRLSAEDYEYYVKRSGEFTAVLNKYTTKDMLAGLADDFALLDDYYQVNCERNNSFMKNIFGEQGSGPAAAAVPAGSGDIGEIVKSLNRNNEVMVVVTGGFHTEGLEKLVEERRISYLAITPNVTQDTGASDRVYTEFAKRQARILSNALALGLASQMSSPELFRMAMEAANRELGGVAFTRRNMEHLVDTLAKATGVDPAAIRLSMADGGDAATIVLNGKTITLNREGTGTRASMEGPAPESVAGTATEAGVRQAVEAIGAILAGASPVDQIPAAYPVLKNLMAFAVDQNIIIGDGLIYELASDPAYRDRIDGLPAEIVGAFPEAVQKIIWTHLERAKDLDERARSSAVLNVVAAVQVARDFLVAVRPAAHEQQAVAAPVDGWGHTVVPIDIAAHEDEFFASLAGRYRKIPLMEFLRQNGAPDEIRRSFDVGIMIGRIKAQIAARFENGEQRAEAVGKLIDEAIEVIYRHIPDDLFEYYYYDAGLVKEHSLMHALKILEICFGEIIAPGEFDAVDRESLVYAALGHDMSYAIYPSRHEKNSATWLAAVLRQADADEATVEKVRRIMFGHEKIRKPGERRPEHELLEARILHDADLLDALDLERIFHVKMDWIARQYPDDMAARREIFLNRDMTVEQRFEVFETGNFYKAIGVTDIMRNAWWKLNPDLVFTDAAKARAGRHPDKNGLKRFLAGKESELRGTLGMDDDDFRVMWGIIDEMYDFLSAKWAADRTARPQEAGNEGKNEVLLSGEPGNVKGKGFGNIAIFKEKDGAVDIGNILVIDGTKYAISGKMRNHITRASGVVVIGDNQGIVRFLDDLNIPYMVAAEGDLMELGKREQKYAVLDAANGKLFLGIPQAPGDTRQEWDRIAGQLRKKGITFRGMERAPIHELRAWLRLLEIVPSEHTEVLRAVNYDPGWLRIFAVVGLLGMTIQGSRTISISSRESDNGETFLHELEHVVCDNLLRNKINSFRKISWLSESVISRVIETAVAPASLVLLSVVSTFLYKILHIDTMVFNTVLLVLALGKNFLLRKHGSDFVSTYSRGYNEDYPETAAKYVYYGDEFRRAVQDSAPLAEKYNVLKEYFGGREYTRNRETGLPEIWEGTSGAPDREGKHLPGMNVLVNSDVKVLDRRTVADTEDKEIPGANRIVRGGPVASLPGAILPENMPGAASQVAAGESSLAVARGVASKEFLRSFNPLTALGFILGHEDRRGPALVVLAGIAAGIGTACLLGFAAPVLGPVLTAALSLAAGAGANYAVHVYLDVHYIDQARESGLSQAIREFGAAAVDRAGAVHTSVYLMENLPADAGRWGLRNTGLNINGKPVWASTRAGALVLFGDGVDYGTLSRDLNESIGERGNVAGSRRLTARLSALFKTAGVEISGKGFRPGIIIDHRATGKKWWYNEDGTMVVTRDWFSDGVDLAESISTGLGELMTIRNAEAVKLAEDIYYRFDNVKEYDERCRLYLNASNKAQNRQLIVSRELAESWKKQGKVNDITGLARRNGVKILVDLGETGDTKENVDRYVPMGFTGYLVTRNGEAFIRDFTLNDVLKVDVVRFETVEQLKEGLGKSGSVHKVIELSDLEKLSTGGDRSILNRVAVFEILKTNILSLYSADRLTKDYVAGVAHAWDREQLPALPQDTAALTGAVASGDTDAILAALNIEGSHAIKRYLEKLAKDVEGTAKAAELNELTNAFLKGIVEKMLAKAKLEELDLPTKYGLADAKLERILGQMLLRQKTGKTEGAGAAKTAEQYEKEIGDMTAEEAYNRLAITVNDLAQKAVDGPGAVSEAAKQERARAINALIELIPLYGEPRQLENKREVNRPFNARAVDAMLGAA
jgi:hypothetical protein